LDLPLTRIVVTLGPAVDDDALLGQLSELGATVARLNFSHGSLVDHAQRIERVRRVCAGSRRPFALLGDLPGPKLRVGGVSGVGAKVGTGEPVIFARGEFIADAAARPLRLSSTYDRLVDELAPGQRVLIDDGNVRLLVESVSREEALCRASSGGIISSGKGINLPETLLSAKAMGERDQVLARWAVEQELDFLALSFVVSAAEVVALRVLIAEEARRLGKDPGFRIPIVAKIERPQAVEAIVEIVEAADAIMVARGDLGVETDFAEVPIVQMRLLDAAHAAGKPCIVATQMLQSMVEAQTPTRAEASDVATAIMAGTDAVMLSAETAVGRWPVAAVDAMRRIALASERWIATHGQRDRAAEGLARTGYRTAALAHGAWHVARDNRAVCIVTWSQAGGGARYLSQNDFTIPILAFSSDARAVRQMALLRSVWPVHTLEVPASLEEWRAGLDGWLLREGWARPGDRVLLVAGEPLGVTGTTDALIVHEVGARPGNGNSSNDHRSPGEESHGTRRALLT